MTEQRIDLGGGTIIRKAHFADVPQIVTVFSDLFVPTHLGLIPELTEEALKKHIEDPRTQGKLTTINYERIIFTNRSIIFVAETNGTIEGYAANDIEDDGTLWISALYVRKQAQRRRRGSGLLHQSISWLREQKKETDIFLDAVQGTLAASIYENLGFSLTGVNDSIELVGRQVIPIFQMLLPVSRQPRALALTRPKKP